MTHGRCSLLYGRTIRPYGLKPLLSPNRVRNCYRLSTEANPILGLGICTRIPVLKYRDYYMLTLDIHLPRRRRVKAEVEEAAETVNRMKDELDAQLQQQFAEVQKQYVASTAASELLTEYRDGLIPQAEAAFRAGFPLTSRMRVTSAQSRSPGMTSSVSSVTMNRDCSITKLQSHIWKR